MSNCSSPKGHGLVGKKRPVSAFWKKNQKAKARTMRDERREKLAAELGVRFN